MATVSKTSGDSARPNENKHSGLLQNVAKDAKPVQSFITKFNNDWVMNFSGMLAYNLLLSIFPIIVAIASIFGLILGTSARTSIVTSIVKVLPNRVSPDLVTNALIQLNKSSGILGILAIILAIFFGSRLFIVIEGCFSIIYHVRQRTLIRQNLMAFGMLLIFVILIPIMIFASSIPTLAASLLKYTFIGQNGFVAGIAGILGGLVACFLLFEAIYFIIPNQKISLRHSWLGALVAAIALELYLTLFPLYIQFALNGYAGQVGFAIILLVFFYYFAVILLLGAEANAFFSEKVQPLPNDLATFVSTMGGKLNKDRPNVEAASHLNSRPTDNADKRHIAEARMQEQSTTQENQHKQQQVAAQAVATNKAQEKKKQPKQPSKVPTFIEVALGSAIAVVIESLRLRRRAR